MNAIPRVAALFGGLLLVAVAAGCSGTTPAEPVVTSGAPAATATATATATAAPEAEHNGADVTFAQMMTVHHEGALEMSALAVDKASSEDVRDLAATIEAAQGPEIELMQTWLTGWGEPVEPSGHEGMDHGGMDMNGLSQEQVMAELGQMSGSGFDTQFLTAMIAHHEGAAMMAEEELRGGNNADALELARSIIDAQQTEIHQMQQLLQDL